MLKILPVELPKLVRSTCEENSRKRSPPTHVKSWHLLHNPPQKITCSWNRAVRRY